VRKQIKKTKVVLVACSNNGCDAAWDIEHGHFTQCPTCKWIGNFGCLDPEEHIKSCEKCKLLVEVFESGQFPT
jgi:hypothetical protein